VSDPPPIHTAAVELTEWTLGRTADFPKGQRHTFGQRLDNLCLDALERITRARFASSVEERREHLRELNLILELMRVFWRIVEKRSWISGAQCLHANRLIDEVGRMAGAWLKREKGQAG
jgi:hypothetical protein